MAGGRKVDSAQLITAFEWYDQQVDIVSAFEFLFTEAEGMHQTVEHFERYPKINAPSPTKDEPKRVLRSTPDFTVLFKDRTGLVGEISRLALHERSVDSTCDQLDRYSTLTTLPRTSHGLMAPVTDVDVMHIVPFRIAPDAVQRIIHQRLLDPDNPFNPAVRPCIVAFARETDGTYTFQRQPDPANGDIRGFNRSPHLGERIGNISVAVKYFKDIKADRKFINDPIPPLYLATHLWIHTWPSQYGGSRDDITVDPTETAAGLRAQFGRIGKDDVIAALSLLAQAGIAAANTDGTFNVSRKVLRGKEPDLHRQIALKAARGDKPLVAATSTRTRGHFEQTVLDL